MITCYLVLYTTQLVRVDSDTMQPDVYSRHNKARFSL